MLQTVAEVIGKLLCSL